MSHKQNMVGKLFLIPESQLNRLKELKNFGVNPQSVARKGIELMLRRYERSFKLGYVGQWTN
jgi:hypothetical protein